MAFIHVLMVKGTGIAVWASVSVTVAALILGKAVLIADLLPRFPAVCLTQGTDHTHLSQFSTVNPETLENSLSLSVTTVASRASA